MGEYPGWRAFLADIPEDRNLIHSDLLNFNVLAHSDRITAVLDWGCSKFGDSLYDLAWFEFYEPWYPEFTSINLVGDLKDAYKVFLNNTDHMDERLLAYKIHIGLDSIAYNASRDDWGHLMEARSHTWTIIREAGLS